MRKARGRPDAATFPHVAVADRYAEAAADAFTELLSQLGRAFTGRRAASLVGVASPSYTAALVAPEIVAKAVTESGLADLFADIALEAGTSNPSFSSSFSLVRDESVVFARQQAAELVQGIDQQTKGLIADVIARGQLGETTWRQMADEIRPLIGLSQRDATAALNYRAALKAKAAKVAEGPRVKAPPDTSELFHAYVDRLKKQRAVTIARTETIRAASAGEMIGWQATIDSGGADGYLVTREWSVTRDDRACPRCVKLDGVSHTTAPIGEGSRPSITADNFDGVPHPPLHPRCFPAGVLVTGPPTVATMKRWYDGPLVEIETRSGKILPATPNHPLLTPGGWVPAGEIHPGDHLTSTGDRDGVMAVDNEDQQVPTRIEQVRPSAGVPGAVSSAQVPVAAPDFHGDGFSEQVDVIWADGMLGDRRESEAREHVAEQGLCLRHRAALRLGDLRLMGGRERLSPDGVMGGAGVGAALLGRALAGQDPVRVGASPDLHTGSAQVCRDPGAGDAVLAPEGVRALPGEVAGDQASAVVGIERGAAGGHLAPTADRDVAPSEEFLDGPRADAVLASELNGGLAGAVFADEVVGVRRVPRWSGHVYNLQTTEEWYTANGILTHNCRCVILTTMELALAVPGEKPKPKPKPETPGERMERMYGDRISVHVQRSADEAERLRAAYLDRLGRLPDEAHRAFIERGGRIAITDGGVGHIPGWRHALTHDGRGWENVGGAFDSATKTVYLGDPTMGGSASISIHEFAHGLDWALGDRETGEYRSGRMDFWRKWRELESDPNIDSYFRVGPNPQTELFAEFAAAHAVGNDAAIINLTFGHLDLRDWLTSLMTDDLGIVFGQAAGTL